MTPDFDNTYAELPDRFYSPFEARPVSDPETLRVNEPLADRLGFDPEWLESPAGAAFVAGNQFPDGAEPIALAYAGHQFGNWVPQLGDGRAVLVGEVVDEEGERFDVQLKGSGRTAYSRRGDGRAPLGPVIREYLVSEAMVRLGVPTTRALAAASTGEQVRREGLQPGGVLVRVAWSHIRVGTFEYFAAREDVEALEILVDYALDRHFAHLDDRSPMGLLREVARRQAALVAQWQLLGFIHGVMNTDNMLLSGQTIDYGPCAFMNTYDPGTVYSSIDRRGRYAYGNQPPIAQWNLERLADSLIPLADDQEAAAAQAEAILEDFPEVFRGAWRSGMAHKLGLTDPGAEDWPLFEDLLELMFDQEVDYTLTFRRLTELAAPESTDRPVCPDFPLPDAFNDWLDRWQERLETDGAPAEERFETMRRANPVFIPRNHLVQRAVDQATREDDLSAFHEMMDVLEEPYDYDPELEEFARPPEPAEEIQATFCGT